MSTTAPSPSSWSAHQPSSATDDNKVPSQPANAPTIASTSSTALVNTPSDTQNNHTVASAPTTSPTSPSPGIAPLSDDRPGFHYPPHYSFPPFYTLQPNQTTRASQLASWSSLILSYCSFHRAFRITPAHVIFANSSLRRSLAPSDARQVLEYMIERGRLEWIDPVSIRKRDKDREGPKGGEGDEAWVWWRTPEEWAQDIMQWVEETGQRNRVLTFYELLEGDATANMAFHGLPLEMAKKAIGGVLGRRGKATLMGEGEGMGAKFF